MINSHDGGAYVEDGDAWLLMTEVRKHARQVWDQVLERNFKRSAVIGSPGIG